MFSSSCVPSPGTRPLFWLSRRKASVPWEPCLGYTPDMNRQSTQFNLYWKHSSKSTRGPCFFRLFMILTWKPIQWLTIRQQAQNGVAYAKPRSPNRDLITVSVLPGMESSVSESGITWSARGRQWPYRHLPSPPGNSVLTNGLLYQYNSLLPAPFCL